MMLFALLWIAIFNFLFVFRQKGIKAFPFLHCIKKPDIIFGVYWSIVNKASVIGTNENVMELESRLKL